VCAYELIFGKRPFRGKTNSDLTHAITRDSLRFPDNAEEKCGREGVHAIASLLDRDITRRLGCKPQGVGFEELKRHAWFKTIDWDTLEDKEFVPPFVPDSKKANFDATHELEELLLEDNPLKARRRNPNQDINNLSAEMRQLEEQFTSYDFEKMKRRSYYPTNQQIVSSITASSSVGGGAPSRPSTPGAIEGRDTISVNVPPLPRTHMMPMEKEAVAL